MVDVDGDNSQRVIQQFVPWPQFTVELIPDSHNVVHASRDDEFPRLWWRLFAGIFFIFLIFTAVVGIIGLIGFLYGRFVSSPGAAPDAFFVCRFFFRV